MGSVIRAINGAVQPYGGYLNPKKMTVTKYEDGITLNENENIRGNLIGLAVDYLTRIMIGATPESAFTPSLKGARLIGQDKTARKLLEKINTNLDDDTIISACKLSGFDVCYRLSRMYYLPIEQINPDEPTIENIRTMVKRALTFVQNYGPITLNGFDFAGGYTQSVSVGDGDYLTKDTLWDFKVMKNEPTSKNTLQLIIYFLLGKRSVHNEFDDVWSIGIFNPRLNKVYKYDFEEEDEEMLSNVSVDILQEIW